MPASALPSKLFFRIGEVAGLVGVEPHVLRYWEREFRSIRPTKSAKGQRVYSRKDVENLLRVRDLLYRDGFTIAGAKKRMQRGPSAEAAIAEVEPETDIEVDRESGVESGPVPEHDFEDDDAPRERTSGLRARAAAEPGVREKLSALRAEVEGFLHELDSAEHA